MAIHRISVFGPIEEAPAKKAGGQLRLPSTVKNDVFLDALLEMPTTNQTRRSPLQWLGALGFHFAIVAALIIVPLFTTATVRVGTGVKAPRQTYSVDPVYPPLARDARISGTVLVDAVIDEHGNVVQARVLSGHPLLIGAALKAVLHWKYEPTTLNGQPVSIELQVEVHFRGSKG